MTPQTYLEMVPDRAVIRDIFAVRRKPLQIIVDRYTFRPLHRKVANSGDHQF